MISVEANWDYNAPVVSTFYPTVTVHGHFFHLIGPSQPLPELRPNFMSICFQDPDYTKQARMRFRYDKAPNISLLKDLKKMLHDVNHYFQAFNALRDWFINDSHSMPYKMFIHADKSPSRDHQERYSEPEASEVAVSIAVV